METLDLQLNQVINPRLSMPVFYTLLSFPGSLDFSGLLEQTIQANPVKQEKTNLDGKLALRIGDSLLGSVEDAASSPSLPKNN